VVDPVQDHSTASTFGLRGHRKLAAALAGPARRWVPRRLDLPRRRPDAYLCFTMIAGSNLPQSRVTNAAPTSTATSQ
jgi:hypothetical protein